MGDLIYTVSVLEDSIVVKAWHWKVEDSMTWEFCSGILKQNHGIEITPQEIKTRFQKFFKKVTGYEVYSKCPKCNGRILPRKSVYGYFVSCSEFPSCNFKGSRKMNVIDNE